MASIYRRSVAALILLASGLLTVAASASAVDSNDGSGKALAKFTVSDQTQVPGKTLPAGSYSIRVVDRLSDRMIVRVVQPGGRETTFLALPKSKLSAASRGPIVVKGGTNGVSALRGFTFPDGTVVEFVYPKAEAVSIAKANDTTIPAIDPASEGRVANPGLSSEDMKMVTLWMLSPTPVTPGDTGPGVTAARYQQAGAAARPRPRPTVAALPHTASDQPLVWLLGLASLAGASLLSVRRMRLS